MLLFRKQPKPTGDADAQRQRIAVRIKSGPVNRTMLLMSGCAAAAILAWPEARSGALSDAAFGMFSFLTMFLTARAARMLVRDYRLRKALALSEELSADHGSARQSTRDERAERGMAASDHGELYGLDDDGAPIWRPEAAPFALIEMPPGVGKTVALVTGSILHRAMLGFSVIVPDIKNDLAVMLAPKLRELGFEVWCINPAGEHLDAIGSVEVNPYGPLVDAVYAKGSRRKDAVKFAGDYAVLHLPPTKDEKNPYFVNGSRRALSVGMLINALTYPTRCTPTDLYALLTDPARFLMACRDIQEFRTSRADDPVLAAAQLEARNMLYRAEHNEENFASFLEGGTQRLTSFSPAGHLGHYGREALHNLSAIRERQIIVFIVTPLSHMREFGDFVSLLNHNIIETCKASPSGHPVHIVGEEALNYRFHGLTSNLEVMRQLRVTADFYIQSFAGLELQYGKEAAAAIESYADVRVYGGLNSFDRAKRVSDMLAEATIHKQDVSYRDDVADLGLSNREMGRRLMTPDEILAMPRNQAWMFARGLRPTRITLVNYAQVTPWTDWVGESPITGTRLHATPILNIDYSKLRGQK